MRAPACFSEVDNSFRDLAIFQALPIPRMKPKAVFSDPLFRCRNLADCLYVFILPHVQPG